MPGRELELSIPPPRTGSRAAGEPAASPRPLRRYLDVIPGWAPTGDPDGIETQFRRHLDTLVPIRERMEWKSV